MASLTTKSGFLVGIAGNAFCGFPLNPNPPIPLINNLIVLVKTLELSTLSYVVISNVTNPAFPLSATSEIFPSDLNFYPTYKGLWISNLYSACNKCIGLNYGNPGQVVMASNGFELCKTVPIVGKTLKSE